MWPVLKGHAFGRAVRSNRMTSALAAEGELPQGLKGGLFWVLSARLKPRPFKTTETTANPELS